MGCCGQTTTGAGAAPPDTGKRVNYTKGMLLGVDDFVQEQAWHIARRHELAREVLGYGTVRGLRVSIDEGAPRVRVSPGLAWMPSGTPVCVPSEQCAEINLWLGKHWDALPAVVHGATQPAPLTVYVVLSYDSCLTDLLPVPGEPCRSEEDLTAASRLADCFKLELRLGPPAQIEEDAIRDFADWLARVPVDASSPPLPETDFLKQLRDAALAWLEPSSPQPADFMFGSPPATLGSSDALLRAALRLWVTELRPLWRARYGCGPLPATPGGVDDAVLLAALELKVHKVDRKADAAVAVVEDARPVLLSLRMVQELMTQNPAPEPAEAVEAQLAFGLAAAVGSDTAYARADHQHGTPTLPLLVGDVVGPIEGNEVVALRGDPIAAVAPADDEVLVFNGGQWSPQPWPLPGAAVTSEQRFGQASNPGAVATATFARSDHTHGTPALAGDAEAVDVGTPAVQQVRVRGLRGVPVDATLPVAGQVLTAAAGGGGLIWRAAALPVPPAPPTPGAVTAQTQFGLLPGNGVNDSAFARADHTHGTPVLLGDVAPLLVAGVQEARVVRLQGRPVANTAPLVQQVLAFNGTSWAPANPASGGTVPPLGGDLSGPVTDAFVERLQKIPLKAPAPSRGDVLTFDGNAWVPGSGASSGGSFVEREAGPFRLVAAGHARISLTAPNAGQLVMLSNYAGLDGRLVAPRTPMEVRLAFKAAVRNPAGVKFGFIVKLTPVWTEANDSNGIEFSPYAVDAVKPGADTIDFQVRLRLSSEADKSQRYELQIEVSRYEL